MSDNRPIVLFDSGVGGISVLREMVRLMPNEDFIFFGDSANAPYGIKTLQQVRDLTVEHISRMIADGAKAVCLACNTATSAAAETLRAMYADVPIIGIEPALKPAALSGGHPNVVVMATPMTLREEKFLRLMQRFEGEAEVYPLPCPDLVRYVEKGILEGEEVEGYLRAQFDSLGDIEIDCVVLGCTHFPFVKNAIRRVLGEGVKLFDGGEGTARQMKRRLQESGLGADEDREGSVTIINSAGTETMLQLSHDLLQMQI